MAVPSLRMQLSAPRTWMVTVRLLEVAALAMLAAAVVEAYSVWRTTTSFFVGPTSVGATGVTLMQHVVGFTLYGMLRAPSLVLTCAVAVGAATALLHVAAPVANGRVLRWEVAVLWVGTFAMGLVLAGTATLSLFGEDPYNTTDSGVVVDFQGPSYVDQVLPALGWPLASLALLGATALWWLRLPAEPGEAPRVAEPGQPQHDSEGDLELDLIALDGVEHIEPVDRRDLGAGHGDGSTTSGYEDFFRRM